MPQIRVKPEPACAPRQADLSGKPVRNEVPAIVLEPAPVQSPTDKTKREIIESKASLKVLAFFDGSRSIEDVVGLGKSVISALQKELGQNPNLDFKSKSLPSCSYSARDSDNYRQIIRSGPVPGTLYVFWGDLDPGGEGVPSRAEMQEFSRKAKLAGSKICVIFVQDAAQESEEYKKVASVASSWSNHLKSARDEGGPITLQMYLVDDKGKQYSDGAETFNAAQLEAEVNKYVAQAKRGKERVALFNALCRETGGLFLTISNDEVNAYKAALKKNDASAHGAFGQKVEAMVLGLLQHDMDSRKKEARGVP